MGLKSQVLLNFKGEVSQGRERPNSQGQREDTRVRFPGALFRSIGCFPSILAFRAMARGAPMQLFYRSNGCLKPLGADCAFPGCLQAGISQSWFLALCSEGWVQSSLAFEG